MNAKYSDPQTTELPLIHVPDSYNYIGVFLTLNCNLRCSYCINRFGQFDRSGQSLSADKWLNGLNALQTRPDLPLTFQGGEPSLHPDFYEIIHGLRPDLQLDLLTNLQFDVDEFIELVPADRFKRDAPYASIRVSYHPETMDLAPLKSKVLKMLARGYSVGIWSVSHPAYTSEIETAKNECAAAGIDFRTKEFLGNYKGKVYGSYTYEDAIQHSHQSSVECRTTELLIGPGGELFRCHSDLYADRDHYGSILDPELAIEDDFRPCFYYGTCNPCDVKTKTNRFQQFGHTSVEIRFPGD